MTDKKKYLLKFTLTASSNDLKQKFISAYLGSEYECHKPFVRVGVVPKVHMIDNFQVTTHLVHNIAKSPSWDFVNFLYTGASGGIILFDKSEEMLKSFATTFDLVEEFRKKIPTPNIPLALVGVDTNTENITTEEGEALAKQLGLTYYETTSPKFENINEISIDLFREVARQKGFRR